MRAGPGRSCGMTTPAERRALMFVVGVAVLGLAARSWRADDSRRATAPDVAALDRQIGAVDSARAATAPGRPRARTRAGAPTARDSTRAPALRGSGRAVTVPRTGTTRASPSGDSVGAWSRYEARRLAVERSNASARARLESLGAAGRPATGPWPRPTPRPGAIRLDLDRATAAELDGLPGIGPALAARIVADRSARGPFGSLAGLQRVRGVGPALAARLAQLVTFSGPGQPPMPEFRR